MSRPTTPTGKRLLEYLRTYPRGLAHYPDMVRAIEREAAAAERERLMAKGEEMYSRLPTDHQPAHALFLLALLYDDDSEDPERG